LKKNVFSGSDSFAIYQKPNDNKNFIAYGNWEIIDENHQFNSHSFFTISIFNGKTYSLSEEPIKLINEPIINNPSRNTTLATSKKSYLKGVNSVIENCKKNNLQKCIISRIKNIPYQNHNYFNIYKKLTLKYRHGFKYILNHPEHGMWIGVSPETLLKGNRSKGFQTQALAGSKAKDSNTEWSKKEYHEHNYVASYIKDIIQNNGELISEGKTQDITAGNVIHLNREYHFNLDQDLFKFVKKLHPTPAIGGFPTNIALDKIAEMEKHNREFYCGYIGGLNKDECELYINLRCAKITQDKIHIYVGGGVTAESEAEEEFKETEIKSQTLLPVFK